MTPSEKTQIFICHATYTALLGYDIEHICCAPFSNTSLTKKTQIWNAEKSPFCGMCLYAEIDGNVSGIMCLLLSVCWTEVTRIVYFSMPVQFVCLKTLRHNCCCWKLMTFILLFCVSVLSSLIFCFITWLFGIWWSYNCEVKVSSELQKMEELGSAVTMYMCN